MGTYRKTKGIQIYLRILGCPQTIYFGPKTPLLGPKRAILGNRGHETDRQTATYRKTEVIQSYLRMWGCYDPTRLDPSDPKKWGLYGCSVKNADFWAKNAVFRPKIHFFQTLSKTFVTIMTGHLRDNIFVLIPLHGGPRGGPRGQFLAQKSAFFYATPI